MVRLSELSVKFAHLQGGLLVMRGKNGTESWEWFFAELFWAPEAVYVSMHEIPRDGVVRIIGVLFGVVYTRPFVRGHIHAAHKLGTPVPPFFRCFLWMIPGFLQIALTYLVNE